MADLLLDVVEYFVSKGLAQGDGIDAFRDFEPEDPDAALIVHEYAGAPQGLHSEMLHRSLQILARDTSAAAAKQKAYELYFEFSPEDRYKELNAERWCLLYPRQTPFRVKIDDKGRHYYGFNVGITTNKEVM